MKQHPCHCKLCGRPITVSIDETYYELGDHLKLIPMATCNRCADIRVGIRNSETIVERVCRRLDEKSIKEEAAAKVLTSVLKNYTNFLSSSMRQSCVFDETVVSVLMKAPREWATILTRYRRGQREARRAA